MPRARPPKMDYFWRIRHTSTTYLESPSNIGPQPNRCSPNIIQKKKGKIEREIKRDMKEREAKVLDKRTFIYFISYDYEYLQTQRLLITFLDVNAYSNFTGFSQKKTKQKGWSLI